MTATRNVFSRLLTDEEGATAVEYGLLAALLGAGIVATVTGLRDSLKQMFGFVGDTINANAK